MTFLAFLPYHSRADQNGFDPESAIREITGSPYVIPGEVLRAWDVAIKHFLTLSNTVIPDQGKNQSLYFVVFLSTESQYVIRWVPKRNDNFEEGARGVEIRVRKSDYEIEKVSLSL